MEVLEFLTDEEICIDPWWSVYENSIQLNSPLMEQSPNFRGSRKFIVISLL